MSTPSLFTQFWTHSECSNAWRLCSEDKRLRRNLLEQLLANLPAEMGTIEFKKTFPDDRLVCLFSHDYDNDGARINEFRILSALANTASLTRFSVENCSGRVNVDEHKAFPNHAATCVACEYLFREHRISPLVAAQLVSPVTIEM